MSKQPTPRKMLPYEADVVLEMNKHLELLHIKQ